MKIARPGVGVVFPPRFVCHEKSAGRRHGAYLLRAATCASVFFAAHPFCVSLWFHLLAARSTAVDNDRKWIRTTRYALFCLLRRLEKNDKLTSRFFGPEFTLHLRAVYDEMRVHSFSPTTSKEAPRER